jgi:hypothetical protein
MAFGVAVVSEDSISEAEGHSVKHWRRDWLFIAAGILMIIVCGGGYVFTQDNSFSLAPVGSYTLPTVTPTQLSSYSLEHEINAVEQTEITGDATLTSTIEAEATTATALQGRTIIYTTNTPLPMNTAISVSTDVPIIVYPSNTPLPPASTQVPANTPVPPPPEPVNPTDVPIVPPDSTDGGGDGDGGGDNSGGGDDGGNSNGNGNGNSNGNGNGGKDKDKGGDG